MLRFFLNLGQLRTTSGQVNYFGYLSDGQVVFKSCSQHWTRLLKNETVSKLLGLRQKEPKLHSYNHIDIYYCKPELKSWWQINIIVFNTRAGVKYVFVFANTNTNTAYLYLYLYLIKFQTMYLYLYLIPRIWCIWQIRFQIHFFLGRFLNTTLWKTNLHEYSL